MDILVNNQLLTLVLVMALGLLIGRVSIGGFRLGVAAVLFVGLLFATIEPAIALPPIMYITGLSLFVYTIGLEAAPGFMQTMRTTGLRHNLFGLVMILAALVLSYVLITALGMDPAIGIGLFTGSLTNTPALAAALDALPNFVADAAILDAPVVAYSLTYPLGVLGIILAIAILAKVFRVNHDQEAEDAGVAIHALTTKRVLVTNEGLPSVTNMPRDFDVDVIISRIEHNGKLYLPEHGDRVSPGDIVSIVGREEELNRAIPRIGQTLPGDPTRDERLDFRRIFVSSSSLVGIPLKDLRPRMSGMLVTRVRRGDQDLVATPETVLQLGDRVRVVADHAHIDRATKLFGDSYRRISDFNLLPLLAGLGLGVLLGMIEIPLPGGAGLKLGNAGGPLIVALILGSWARTGPIVWQVPYGANLALRQLGIAIFLAGIGTTAGAGFGEAIQDPYSLVIIGVSAVITVALALLTLTIGHKVFKIPFGQVAGILAGLQTHPAVLSYVSEQTKNELPAMGYTAVYPMAMIAKIVCTQVLLFLLFL